jgi:type II secretory pathway pseudopilin PulG
MIIPSSNLPSFHPSKSSHSAFTLLEVIIAISVAMFVVGISALSITGMKDEHRLHQMASLLETTARDALLRAVTDYRVIQVEISPDSITAPTASASDAGEEHALEGSIEIKRHGERAFRKPKNGEVWEFSPTGICEPMELRVRNQTGSIEIAFDPLTGIAKRKSVIVNG